MTRRPIDIWHREAGRARWSASSAAGWPTTTGTWASPGPADPCSEIYYDRGPEYGREGGPVVDEDRYLEVWNLVFMQSELGEVRTKVDFDIRGDLPNKNIDTGMGLERMAPLLQGVDNIYEIDTTRHILDRAMALSGAAYGARRRTDVDLRVVADHARACAFLIGDGVMPGNEGRGYVLRRILRRVVQKMRLLGAGTTRSIGELVGRRDRGDGPAVSRAGRRRRRITSDGRRARRRVPADPGPGHRRMLRHRRRRRSRRRASDAAGTQAFALHDTYGFPIEITLEMAADAGVEVDEDGFRELMARAEAAGQGGRPARKAGLRRATVYREVMDAAGATDFRLRPRWPPRRRCAGCWSTGAAVPAAGPGTTSRSCWTARRSTPRAAGRSATRAGSAWPTVPCSTC